MLSLDSGHLGVSDDEVMYIHFKINLAKINHVPKFLEISLFFLAMN